MDKFLMFIISLVILSSCTTVKEVEVPIVNTKIEYRDKLVYDSIYCHDSIYTYIKGDTVISYKEHINTRYINRTDTLVRTDTIQVPVTVTKIKEVNKLYKWQEGLITIGAASLIAYILIFGYLCLKYIKGK